jgi:hypothetical protein
MKKHTVSHSIKQTVVIERTDDLQHARGPGDEGTGR